MERTPEKINKNIGDEQDLNQLLDSAFSDFFKPGSSSSQKGSGESGSSKAQSMGKTQRQKREDDSEESDECDKTINDILNECLGNEPELQEHWAKLNESCKKAADLDPEEACKTLTDTLKNLCEGAQKINQNKDLEDISDEEFSKFWTSICESAGVPPNAPEEGGEPDILPFVTNFMQNMLSKQVLYPSMKDLSERYPAWLDANRDKLEPDELSRYSSQLEYLQQVCSEFEAEQDSDSRQVKDERFQRILLIMKQMRDCGSPPNDLIDSSPDMGNEFDMSKIPNMDKMAPNGQPCSIM
ncbi:peroxisomal biogenesis factor 19 [Brevipalpus obovatus]|uniref:peroxisomal biogenesis factor 19 n=1 Tax=Brevipalpus obovatus TaxID=246614 RepID=UPI003D9EA3E0